MGLPRAGAPAASRRTLFPGAVARFQPTPVGFDLVTANERLVRLLRRPAEELLGSGLAEGLYDAYRPDGLTRPNVPLQPAGLDPATAEPISATPVA